MSESITTDILSAVADRRTRDLRFRQRQLISLHDWITKNVPALEVAISTDDGISIAEAQIVIGLALHDLKKNYESLDLKKELDVEFRIKNGRNNEDRRLPQEIVYVIPSSYTLFHGVMSALCASVAAGSCCVIEVPNSQKGTPALIRTMASQSLDRSAFRTSTTRLNDDFLKRVLLVDQQDCVSSELAGSRLTSQRSTGAVAIVDRKADVAAAARAIAASILLFGGKGPYAPSCILVNEYVEEEFSRLFAEHASAKAQIGTGLNDFDHSSNGHKQEAASSGVGKISSASRKRLIRLSNREDLREGIKQNHPETTLIAFSSLDDAIDLLNSAFSPRIRALYAFANPKAAKYLAQFIQTDVSFVNHIPASLLVGPPAPSGYSVLPTLRYRREMMEVPSAQFVDRSPRIPSVEDLVGTGSTGVSTLLTTSLQALKPTGQPREGDMNFFAQGLRASFILYIYLPMAVAIVAVAGYGGKYARRHWL